MQDSEVVAIIRAHAESQFPLPCTSCSRVYADLRQFLLETTRVGKPVSYDAEEGDWRPLLPIGTMAQFNCACGTTLTMASEGMPLTTVWRLLWWLRKRHKATGKSLQDVLAQLQDQIDAQVLADGQRSG